MKTLSKMIPVICLSFLLLLYVYKVYSLEKHNINLGNQLYTAVTTTYRLAYYQGVNSGLKYNDIVAIDLKFKTDSIIHCNQYLFMLKED